MKKTTVIKLFKSMRLSFDDFKKVHGNKEIYDFKSVGDFIEEVLHDNFY